MAEELSLSSFEEWYLIDLSWNPQSGLLISLESPDKTVIQEIVFQSTSFIKILADKNASNPSEMAENEIWRFQEIIGSRLLQSVQMKDDWRYLTSPFGDTYERSHVST